MTLCLRVSTPQGLVFCADSLVTYPETVEIIDGEKSGDWINSGEYSPGSPAMLINPVTKYRTFVKDTKQNVNKICRVLNYPLAMTVAGTASLLISRVNDGTEERTVVPFESFVPIIDEVVASVVENNPEMSLTDISRCACFVLCCGANGANRMNRGAGKVTPFSLDVLGGGYSSDSPWPQIFNLNLSHRGQVSKGLALLDAASSSFLGIISDNLPNHCSSVNWFAEFCDKDLKQCIDAAVVQASVWTAFYKYDKELTLNNVLPDVLSHLRSITLLLGRLIKRFGISGLANYEFSEIITEMWYLRNASYHDEQLSAYIDEIFDDYMDDSSELIGLYFTESDPEIAKEKRTAFFDSIRLDEFSDEERDAADGYVERAYYNRLGDKEKNVLSFEASLGLSQLLFDYIRYVAMGDKHFVENDDTRVTHQSYFTPATFWFSLDYSGQSDVVERLMKGMDSGSEWAMSSDIRNYTMSACNRLSELISAGLDGRPAPPPSNPLDSAGSFRDDDTVPAFASSTPIESDDNPDGGEDEDDDGKEGEQGESTTSELPAHAGFPSGQWSGFFSTKSTKDSITEDIKTQFNVTIETSIGESSTFSGHGLSDGNNIEIGGGVIGTDEISFELKISMEGRYDSAAYEVQGNLEEWGFNGTLDLEGERGNIIMWPTSRMDPGVDTHSIVRDSLQTLNSELEVFRPDLEGSRWDIDWTHLALDTSVELALYLMESTIKKQHFNSEVPTVGGKIKTVTISPNGEYHEI